MQYLLLIASIENGDPQGSDREEMYKRYAAFSQEVRDAGKLVGANELQPVATATTVRVRNGETLTTDGPFAETKEQLGGYYLLDCADIDEAIAYAAKIPSAERGSIEVRPIVER
jgi:hypothetical protein